MDKLYSFDKIVLRDYLADDWASFASWCEQRDADPDKIYEALGGEPD